MQAIEIERERREFERIVRVQRAAFCREKKELEQKQQQALIHRSEILKQVRIICLRAPEKMLTYWYTRPYKYNKLYYPISLGQVNEKERERIAERQKMFEEGLAIRAETAKHKKKLQDAIERKCQEMRENKVPDIYINEVKRMIETIQ